MRWPLFFLMLLSPALSGGSPEQEVRALLERQQADWNRGDLEAFMTGYLVSDAITFLGSNGITRGYQNVLERYRRAYPTQERMGTLRFTFDEIRLVTPDVAVVLGQFALTRQEAGGGNAAGRFTLILRRSSDGWRIVHDHTSS